MLEIKSKLQVAFGRKCLSDLGLSDSILDLSARNGQTLWSSASSANTLSHSYLVLELYLGA